jgi:hypothetical protein
LEADDGRAAHLSHRDACTCAPQDGCEEPVARPDFERAASPKVGLKPLDLPRKAAGDPCPQVLVFEVGRSPNVVEASSMSFVLIAVHAEPVWWVCATWSAPLEKRALFSIERAPPRGLSPSEIARPRRDRRGDKPAEPLSPLLDHTPN